MIPEQPTAPYLDAVVAYGFRGPGRFHVPGPQGRRGRRSRPAPRDRRRRAADRHPAGHPRHRPRARSRRPTSGPSRWPPRPTARRARGSSPTARRRATTRWRWRWRRWARRVVAQRNSHASLVDGLVLSGGLPSFVAPEYDEELGMAHGVTPEALAAALDATDAARAAFIVSPTYYGMAADVEGCAAVCHERGVPLVVDQAWGPHFGFHPDLPPSALAQGADAVLTSTHKIVGSLTQSAMLHVADTGRDRHRGGRPRDAARALDVAVLAADGLARRRAPPARRPRRGAAARDDRGCRAHAREDGEDPGHRARRRRLRRAVRASPGGTRCASSSTCAGRAAPATRSPRRCAAPTTSSPSWRPTRRWSCCSASRSRRVSLERVAGDVDEIVKRISREGTGRRARAPAEGARERDGRLAARRVPRRGRGRAGRRRRRPHLVRVDRRLPAGHPGAAAGRADHRPRSSPTCASCATPARACTARATRRSRRSRSCVSARAAPACR